MDKLPCTQVHHLIESLRKLQIFEKISENKGKLYLKWSQEFLMGSFYAHAIFCSLHSQQEEGRQELF